jgi:lambda family phage tail tape measure protein
VEAEMQGAQNLYETLRDKFELMRKAGHDVSGDLEQLKERYDQLTAAIMNKARAQQLGDKEQAADKEVADRVARMKADAEEARRLLNFQRDLKAGTMAQDDATLFLANEKLQDQLRLIEELGMACEITDAQEKEMTANAVAGFERTSAAIKKAAFDASEFGRMLDYTQNSFASGFSHAFVQFASGAESAKEAFRNFAASFLKDISEMILKQTILNILQGVLKGFGGGFDFGGAIASGAISYGAGGVRFAANGIQTLNQPTFLPKFNVIAGEAGAEMLTVLARPRLMDIGGIQAAVGNAGRDRLAITDANQLQQRMGSGRVDITIHMEPGLKASIINDASNVAVVRVAHDLKTDSEISRGVKGVAS